MHMKFFFSGILTDCSPSKLSWHACQNQGRWLQNYSKCWLQWVA